MIYNVVLVSDIQQNDLVIHICISILFQILFPYRLLQRINVLLCNFLKFNIVYVRFIPADGRNCCNNIFIAVHRCSSIFHPQTFGLFACFYYHKAGMNILKHMCRSISMLQSGVAGLGVHTSSTSIDSKLCPKWLQQLACLPAENQYSSSTKLLKVSEVSELNVCQWCSYKIWLSFSLLTNELDNFFLFIQHLVK